MLTLYGKKLGMTQKFVENGDLIPVTVIQCGPCTVVQKKTKKKEGYNALQLGFDEVKKLQRVNRSKKGHFQKAKTPVFRYVSEIRTEDVDLLNVGDSITAEVFHTGDKLNIRGLTKGRGFQGVIKRHGKHGGGAAHGSHFHRAPGSIGQNSSPARVIPGMKMPGHMGDEFKTIKNLEVISVENNLLFVKGAVPGAKNGLLRITTPKVKLVDRFKKKEEAATEPAPAKEETAEESKEN